MLDVIQPEVPEAVRNYLAGAPKRLLIGGCWVAGTTNSMLVSINPATGLSIAELAAGGAEDVDGAVRAARAAFEGPWSSFTPAERAHLINRIAELIEDHAEELAVIDTVDMGAPLSRSLAAVRAGIARLRWNSSQAMSIHGRTPRHSLPGDYLTYTLKEPVGVVAAIIPWNSPVASTLWKLGPVLASGCTVVLKPAEESSLSALRLAELCLEAGVPEGVVNVVTGTGETVGAALAAHPGVDKVAFTGSLEAAQHVIRASAGNLKRLSLELGGKSPNIVFADADLDAAVTGAAHAIFANSGQICSAGARLFVQRPVYDEFVERVADFGRRLTVGDGLDPQTDIGPLVSQAQLERVLGFIDVGRSEGARVASGGGRPAHFVDTPGFYVEPTVFGEVGDEMTVAREEIFGPVLAALPFDTEEEVLRRANGIPVGLASGVWTRNGGTAHRLAKLLRTGTVWINCYQVMDPSMPFGGYRMSGYGREGGAEHLEEYLEVKSVYANLAEPSSGTAQNGSNR
jgi:aldehyde dehydrogenase (NAD+)